MRVKPLSALAFLAALAVPAAGLAAPTPCSALDNPVYVSGGPAVEPYLRQVAQLLQRSETQRLTVIWQLKSSCNAVDTVVRDTGASCTAATCMTGQASFWTLDPRDNDPKECDLPTTGARVDVALSDVFPQTCPAWSQTPPTGVIDYSPSTGPISPYAIVMAQQAGETAIHATEGHFVFGMGKAAEIPPWQNDAVIFSFGDQDAGQLLVGQQLRMALGRWKGVSVDTAEKAINLLYSDPAQGIGVLPTTVLDKRRAEVKALAFKAMQGRAAYWPDRRPELFDKANVRDGHYPIWGYLHAVMQKDPAMPTMPRSKAGQRLADYVLGVSSTVGGKETLLLQVQSGLVPRCAMKVARKDDRSPMTPWVSSDSCHCWYDKNVQGGVLGCSECPDGMDATCGGIGKCRRKLCEVQ